MTSWAPGAVGFAAVVVLAACDRPKTIYVVRPLTVEVLDAETGRALRGIRVQRLYETERYTWSNPLEPSGHRYLLSTFETDADGRVRLPREPVALAGREHFTHEMVCVNLEAAPGAVGWDDTPGGRLSRAVLEAWSPERGDAVVTPATAYRGYEIVSVDANVDGLGQEAPGRPRYDARWNAGGLARPEETIVVKLGKHRSARETGAPAR